MNLRDYIVGRRVELISPRDRESVERAIRSNLKLGFNPFYTGVVGWTRFGRVRLRWATAMWSNGLQPVFLGRLRSDHDSTKLSIRFGAPLYVLAFLAVWYLHLSVAVVLAFGQYISGASAAGEAFLFVAVASGMMVIPITMHFIFNRNASTHLDRMIKWLAEVAEFRDTQSGISA